MCCVSVIDLGQGSCERVDLHPEASATCSWRRRHWTSCSDVDAVASEARIRPDSTAEDEEVWHSSTWTANRGGQSILGCMFFCCSLVVCLFRIRWI